MVDCSRTDNHPLHAILDDQPLQPAPRSSQSIFGSISSHLIWVLGYENLSPNGVQQKTFNEGAKGHIKKENFVNMLIEFVCSYIPAPEKDDGSASMSMLEMKINLRRETPKRESALDPPD